MTDPKYMRPGLDFAIGKAVEEAGEFLHAIGKTIRWGWGSSNPELPVPERVTNRQWVTSEMRDLREALDNLEAEMRERDEWDDTPSTHPEPPIRKVPTNMGEFQAIQDFIKMMEERAYADGLLDAAKRCEGFIEGTPGIRGDVVFALQTCATDLRRMAREDRRPNRSAPQPPAEPKRGPLDRFFDKNAEVLSEIKDREFREID